MPQSRQAGTVTLDRFWEALDRAIDFEFSSVLQLWTQFKIKMLSQPCFQAFEYLPQIFKLKPAFCRYWASLELVHNCSHLDEKIVDRCLKRFQAEVLSCFEY
jgi:hypothetical protein